MNSKKFAEKLYPVREATDLKDILFSTIEEFSRETAYLVKDKKQKKFVPITYEEVGEDISSLGTKFLDLGLRGEKIAVIGDTSYEWLLTYFATVSVGSIIVPLDRNLPEDEILNLVKRSGAKAIVYSKKLDAAIKKIKKTKSEIKYFISMEEESNSKDKILSLHKLLEEGSAIKNKGNDSFYQIQIDPKKLSVLMFTSGTTGKSKGVMLSQENIAANVVNMSRFVKVHEGDVVLSILPVHHAYAMTCVIWTTFFQGRTIAICEGLKYIQKNMVEVKANILVGVPLVFEKMHKGIFKQAKKNGEEEKLKKAIKISKKLKLYNNPKIMKKMFKTIHNSLGGGMNLFIAGGAAIDSKVIEDFEAMGIPMIQGYGMTENSPIITVNQDRYSIPSSVGKPLVGTKVKVVNENEEGVGEIYCKGPSVMLGYYKNEEETKKVLVEDGWLNTGDLGYIDEKGFLYLTGRKKTVIVTKGGKNIFPEEIESVLLEDDYFKEVLIHGVPDNKTGNVVITVDIFPNFDKVKEKKGEMNSSELYYFYKELVEKYNGMLPPYKNIRRINLRDKEFEKTTTGKVKRYGNAIIKDSKDGASELLNKQLINDMNESKVYLKRLKQAYVSAKNTNAIKERNLENLKPIINIKSMLKEMAKEKGDKEVILLGKRKVTYKELNSDVIGMGTALINEGYGDDKIVPKTKNSYNQLVLILACLAGVGTLSLNGKVRLDDKKLKELIEKGRRLVSTGDRQFIDREIEGKTVVIDYGKKITSMELSKAIMKGAIEFENVEDKTINAYIGHFGQRVLYGLLIPLYVSDKISLEANKGDLIICDKDYGNRIFKHCKEVLLENGKVDIANRRIKWNRWTKKVGVSSIRPIISQLSHIINQDVDQILVIDGKLEKEAFKFFEAIDIKVVSIESLDKKLEKL